MCIFSFLNLLADNDCMKKTKTFLAKTKVESANSGPVWKSLAVNQLVVG